MWGRPGGVAFLFKNDSWADFSTAFKDSAFTRSPRTRRYSSSYFVTLEGFSVFAAGFRVFWGTASFQISVDEELLPEEVDVDEEPAEPLVDDDEPSPDFVPDELSEVVSFWASCL